MALDKWIAALFLAGSVAYGYAAFTYPILPFERLSPILPNTWPKVLALAAAVLSLLVLVAPAPGPDAEGRRPGRVDLAALRRLKLGQAGLLVAAMVAYALLLRPLGFLAATVLFLLGTGAVLGERRLILAAPIAGAGALVVWALVDPLLGIVLRPLPAGF